MTRQLTGGCRCGMIRCMIVGGSDRVRSSEIVYYHLIPVGFEAAPGIPLHRGPSSGYCSHRRHGRLH